MRSEPDLPRQRAREPAPTPRPPVPLMDPRRTYATWGPDAEQRVQDILRQHVFVAGPHVVALEHELSKRLGGIEAVAVDSGTDALWLALRAWFERLPSTQREVIVPAFTFVATAGAVVAAGGTPVFADVDPDTYLMDLASVAARVSDRTAAIVPVHLFGLPMDVAPLRALAPHARVLEDAAQAIDATWQGRPAGTLGDAATFSFYPSKNLGAAGDGGLVTSADTDFADRVRALRSHGQEQRGEPHDLVGTNSRMDEIQAAVLGAKLPYLTRWTAQRREVAARYDEGLQDLPLHTPTVPAGAASAWHLYTVRLPDEAQREMLRAALQQAGIGCGVYYGRPVHREPCFAPFAPAPCPQADHLSRTVLSLPCFPGLRPEEQARVVETVRRALTPSAARLSLARRPESTP